jgi:hypothetical protein
MENFEMVIAKREPTRQQHQGIAQGLDVVGLDPAVGWAVWLFVSWLRQTASQLAD